MNFKKLVLKEKEIIDTEIERILSNEIKKQNTESIKEIYKLIKNYVSLGGKRLRGIALIKTCKSCNGRISDSIKAAAGIELLHNSTLIHDDIMDEDPIRRNYKTVFKTILDNIPEDKNEEKEKLLFNSEAARVSASKGVIAGNILASIAFECMPSEETKKILLDAYKIVNDGQLLDMEFEAKNITEYTYNEVAKKKTAYLFRAAILIGAQIAKADQKTIKALSDYAMDCALAFQLQDDIMDITPEFDKGNTFASDIRNGKRTLIVIKTLENSKDKDKLLEILDKSDNTDEEINLAIKIINESGGVLAVKETAAELKSKALLALDNADISEEGKEFFTALADYMIERKI